MLFPMRCFISHAFIFSRVVHIIGIWISCLHVHFDSVVASISFEGIGRRIFGRVVLWTGCCFSEANSFGLVPRSVRLFK